MTSYAALPEELKSGIGLLVAFVLGTIIGAERQYRQRTAGLRTAVLVAVGASAFVDLGMRLTGGDGATRTVAYVISGIGFLGAGVIMKEGMNVRGLNTAATLWCSAAVGACTGADMVAEAGLLTVFVIAGNTLLRPLVNAIDRSPIDERTTEATYEVSLTARERDMPSVREALSEALEAAHYPAGDIETEERGEEMVEIVATLVSTAVDPVEMDALALRLGALPGVSHASWAIRTKD